MKSIKRLLICVFLVSQFGAIADPCEDMGVHRRLYKMLTRPSDVKAIFTKIHHDYQYQLTASERSLIESSGYACFLDRYREGAEFRDTTYANSAPVQFSHGVCDAGMDVINELGSIASDVAYIDYYSIKEFLGDEDASIYLATFDPSSGLFQLQRDYPEIIDELGVDGFAYALAEGMWDETIGGLASGDPYRIGRGTTNTLLLVIPATRAGSAAQGVNLTSKISGARMAIMGDGTIALVPAQSLVISGTGALAIESGVLIAHSGAIAAPQFYERRGNENASRSPKEWTLTKALSDKKAVHQTLGVFYRHDTTGLWWIKDNSRHGGKAFKVYKETPNGLAWYKDADEFGNFIENISRGDTYREIPWNHLKVSDF